MVKSQGTTDAPVEGNMTTEAEELHSREKQRAQQIQAIQAERHPPGSEEDLGSPAEDDGEDATTRFAHEVKRAEQREIAARLARLGPR